MTNRELSGRNDVRGGRVDDHDTGGRGALDVNVVEADTGTSDDLEVGCCGNNLSVDLGGRANQNRVCCVNRLEQCRTVCSVNGANVKIRAQSLNGCGRKFFSDEHDGLGHEQVLTTGI